MQYYWVKPSKISGTMNVPASKSHSIRAILFASLAQGRSLIHSYLQSPDIVAMIRACLQFGAKIQMHQDFLEITGVGGDLQTPHDVIDAGNSGQILRFIGAIAGLISDYTVMTGDASLRYQRSVQALLSGLEQLGCFAVATRQEGYAPIIVRGPILGGDVIIDGRDSQPVSGLIMASCFATRAVNLYVENPGELPWVQLTLSWLDTLAIPYQTNGSTQYRLQGGARIHGFEYQVPGDFSSAAFLLVAACITRSKLILTNLDLRDVQGDKKIIEVLRALGLHLEVLSGQIIVDAAHFTYSGLHLDLNMMIDALPILTVLACYAESESYLYGVEVARHKESDRLFAMTTELRKMGADIVEMPDGLMIQPSCLQGAVVDSHADHRVAMALAVAGLAAQGETKIMNTTCVAKSFGDFVNSFTQLGAKIFVCES